MANEGSTCKCGRELMNNGGEIVHADNGLIFCDLPTLPSATPAAGSTKPTYSELELAIMRTLCVDVCDEDEETTYLLPAEPEPIVCDSLAEVVQEFYELANREMLKLEAAETSLARVRGLLQHFGVHKADCGTWDVTYGDRENKELMAKACDCGLTAELSTFPQSSSLVSQRAESADIGKLDAADEGEWKGLPCPHDAAECYTVNGVDEYNCSDCGAPLPQFSEPSTARSGVEIVKVNRVEGKYLNAQAWLCPEGYSSPRLRPWMVGVNFTDLIALLNEYGAYVAGSAETGGEKAKFHGHWFCPNCKQKTVNIYLPDSDEPSGNAHYRCENCDWDGSEPANFPRSSQNQTVSSGVDGAHEGTAADKNGASREPEKLNNAQKSGITICFHRHTTSTWDKQGVESMVCKDCGKEFHEVVALAESSLSQKENDHE